MEGTARAHGATLLRCRLLHLMQLGAGVAGPGVELGEAGQVAEALLVPWGCSLVPKSSAVPRSLEKDLSGWPDGREVLRQTDGRKGAAGGGSTATEERAEEGSRTRVQD